MFIKLGDYLIITEYRTYAVMLFAAPAFVDIHHFNFGLCYDGPKRQVQYK